MTEYAYKYLKKSELLVNQNSVICLKAIFSFISEGISCQICFCLDILLYCSYGTPPSISAPPPTFPYTSISRITLLMRMTWPTPARGNHAVRHQTLYQGPHCCVELQLTSLLCVALLPESTYWNNRYTSLEYLDILHLQIVGHSPGTSRTYL